MPRYIDAGALLNEPFAISLSDVGHSNEWNEGVRQGIMDTLQAVRLKIENAPTVNEWISVKERLPEDEQWVAALLYGFVGVIRNPISMQYNAKKRVFIDEDGIEFDIDDVAYWFGLPEPREVEK